MNSQTSLPTAWLVSDGRVLASADVANTPRARRRGLIGQRTVTTVLVLDHCRWIHTIGVKCTLDIAYLNADRTVIKIQRLVPMRVPLPVTKSCMVIEASAGSFERWGLHIGDVIEVRYT
jgi:hypothetical protein